MFAGAAVGLIEFAFSLVVVWVGYRLAGQPMAPPKGDKPKEKKANESNHWSRNHSKRVSERSGTASGSQ